jgi:hypothetical protein
VAPSCVSTPAALAHLAQHGVTAASLFARHQSGDWGDICAADADENALSLTYGFRVLSCYVVGCARLYVITEADRSVTTILLTSEY